MFLDLVENIPFVVEFINGRYVLDAKIGSLALLFGLRLDILLFFNNIIDYYRL